MRTAGVIVLAMVPVYFGVVRSGALTKRVAVLYKIILMIQEITTEIMLSRESVGKMINKISKKDTYKSLEFLYDRAWDNTENFQSSWRDGIEHTKFSMALSEKDISLLKAFGEGLGTSDISGQKSHLELFSVLFSSQLDEAKKEFAQKKRLYMSLGILLGVATAVMLI